MTHEILYKPSYAMLRFALGPGEVVMTEAGSMVAMSPNMQVKTSLNTSHGENLGFFTRFFSFLIGLFIALMRKILGGESFFINRYRPDSGEGELLLAPVLNGDVIHYPMSGRKVMVQASSYLASTPGVSMKLKFSGLRGLFSGESLFFLACDGTGDLWINSYGGIEELEVDGSLVVDTGHVVAFESGLEWKIKTVGGLKSTVLSGEGLVMEFNGKGRLWIQTRNLPGFRDWMTPLLPG